MATSVLWCIEIDDVLIFKPFATLRALKYNEEGTSNHEEWSLLEVEVEPSLK